MQPSAAGRNRLQVFARTLHIGAPRANLASDLHGALAKHEIELHYQPIVEIEFGPRHQGRGAGALAPSPARRRAAQRIHPDRRGDGAHRRDRRLGFSSRRGSGVALAARFRSPVRSQRQRLGGPACGAGRRGGQFRPAGGAAGPGRGRDDHRDHRKRAHRRLREHTQTLSPASAGRASPSRSTISAPAILRSPTSRISKSTISRPTAPLFPASTERSREYAICGPLVAMANKLSIWVIAEGVESETQRALLAAAGCDCAQGYLYARPMPAKNSRQCFLANGAPSSPEADGARRSASSPKPSAVA